MYSFLRCIVEVRFSRISKARGCAIVEFCIDNVLYSGQSCIENRAILLLYAFLIRIGNVVCHVHSPIQLCIMEPSSEQQAILDLLDAGTNLVCSSSAGVGKSWLIRHYAESTEGVCVCATTGCAASEIGGKTWHSALGWTPDSDFILAYELNRKRLHRTIRKIKVLIIDEVSMMSAQDLHYISELLKLYKKSSEPFGGVHIALFGDMFQLEPVSGNLLITSPLLKDFKVCQLTKSFRQSGDDMFFGLLERLRRGICTPADIKILKSRVPAGEIDAENTTFIYCTNRNVDFLNVQELCILGNPVREFKSYNPSVRPHVKLCVGAFVMARVNGLCPGIFNGTRGRVVEVAEGFVSVKFETLSKPFQVRMMDDRTRSEIERETCEKMFMPLSLCWAVTVHKSQGMTLESAVVDLSGAFACGQAYTAISRVRSLDGLKIVSFDEKCIRVNPDAKKFFE